MWHRLAACERVILPYVLTYSKINCSCCRKSRGLIRTFAALFWLRA